MAKRDYRNLSDVEFEELVADLLTAETGDRFIRFAAGRDGGVDLRRQIRGLHIVQCKHYQRSTFPQLRRDVSDEVRRVQHLPLGSYVLATSMELTVHQHSQLEDVLRALPASSILAGQDIDGLLTKHESIERQHVKLWLGSSAPLNALLHADVYGRSSVLVEQIREALPLYVSNPSFADARRILDNERICIIAGPPGIGKTMLARMLLLDWLGRGYEPIEVSEDINEAFRVYRPGEPQAFYYDDFLGRTDLAEKMGKNEDHRLSAFIERVAGSTSKVLILTTREYVLQQARERYEELDRVDLSRRRYVLQMTAYGRLARARILYNHLFRLQDSARPSIAAFVRERAYLRVVDHANYNPRLIEAIASTALELAQRPDAFAPLAIQVLDRPQLIWRRAFESHLDNVQRSLLLVLATFPPAGADLQNLAEALEQFASNRGVPLAVGQFEGALKVLEGTFIRISRRGSRRVVALANPSVLDFMLDFLAEARVELAAVLKSVRFFEQAELVASLEISSTPSNKVRTASLRDSFDVLETDLGDALARHIDTAPPRGVRPWIDPRDQLESGLEHRLKAMLELCARRPKAVSRDWLEARLGERVTAWSAGRGSRGGAIALVSALVRLWPERAEAAIDALRALLLVDLRSIANFRALITFNSLWPGRLGKDEWAAATAEFYEVATDQFASYDPSPPDLDEIASLADHLGVSLDDEIQEARERERDAWHDDDEPDIDEGDRRETRDATDADMDTLFARMGGQ